jgi:acetylglutamate kinase
VTDAAAIDATSMVLNGLINTRLLALCREFGIAGLGVSGVDGGLVQAHRRAPVTLASGEVVDYGMVGDIDAVDGSVLARLLDDGFLPVVSPLSCDKAGQLLNINADTVAGNVAAAVGASRLVFLTDVEGVRGADGKVLTSLAPARARELIADGTIAGGMIPKVEACLHAASLGVSVQIVDGRNSGMLLATTGAGTTISPD